MYDITKFLEDRKEIYISIESQELLDGGTKVGRIEIHKTIDNVDFSAEILVEQYDNPSGMESVVSVLDSYYISPENDTIPCTASEERTIINVIKSIIQ